MMPGSLQWTNFLFKRVPCKTEAFLRVSLACRLLSVLLQAFRPIRASAQLYSRGVTFRRSAPFAVRSKIQCKDRRAKMTARLVPE